MSNKSFFAGSVFFFALVSFSSNNCMQGDGSKPVVPEYNVSSSMGQVELQAGRLEVNHAGIYEEKKSRVIERIEGAFKIGGSFLGAIIGIFLGANCTKSCCFLSRHHRSWVKALGTYTGGKIGSKIGKFTGEKLGRFVGEKLAE